MKTKIKCYLPDFRIIEKVASFQQQVGYQISRHNIPDVWLETQGEGVTVAVLDTGCQLDHPDLADALIPGHNAHDHNDNVMDDQGHGTHCTGIITANNNTDGIVGVAPKCKVLVVKVLGSDGGLLDNVALGVVYAIDQGADVISMSLGGPEGHPILHDPIKRAYEANIPIICAAGNSGDIGQLSYPAKYPETISIGALNNANLRAAFSQTGPMLDFMAPGVEIYSTYPTNTYQHLSGTSMATPWAAGVVALMIAKHRKLGGRTPVNTVEDIREHLIKTAIDIREVGKDNETGFGIIDVRATIRLIEDNRGEIPMPTPFEGLSDRFNAWMQTYAEKSSTRDSLTTQTTDIQAQIDALTAQLTPLQEQLGTVTSELSGLEEKATQINDLLG